MPPDSYKNLKYKEKLCQKCENVNKCDSTIYMFHIVSHVDILGPPRGLERGWVFLYGLHFHIFTLSHVFRIVQRGFNHFGPPHHPISPISNP